MVGLATGCTTYEICSKSIIEGIGCQISEWRGPVGAGGGGVEPTSETIPTTVISH